MDADDDRGPPRRVAGPAGAARRDAAEAAPALVEFLRGTKRFAFHDRLAAVIGGRDRSLDRLAEDGEFLPIVEALLSADGRSYESLPQGLLEFHDSDDGPRTPFEEHLIEAAHYVRGGGGTSRLHLTVSGDHLGGFRDLFSRVRKR